MTDLQLQQIEHAKQYMFQVLSSDVSGHDDFHVLRVYNLALQLAKGKDVNLFVLSMATLLHDLDDYKIAGSNSNRVMSYLESQNIKEKHEIKEIIDHMSFTSYKQGKTVSTLEGQIVQDADRLDALGAIGIARCFAYSGVKNRPLYKNDKDDDSSIAHFYQKLLKLPELMNTSEAKLLAETRVHFMKLYLKNFFEEWELKI